METTTVVELGLCVNTPQANRTQDKQTPWASVIILNSEILQVPSRSELWVQSCSSWLKHRLRGAWPRWPPALAFASGVCRGSTCYSSVLLFSLCFEGGGCLDTFTVYLETKPPFWPKIGKILEVSMWLRKADTGSERQCSRGYTSMEKPLHQTQTEAFDTPEICKQSWRCVPLTWIFRSKIILATGFYSLHIYDRVSKCFLLQGARMVQWHSLVKLTFRNTSYNHRYIWSCLSLYGTENSMVRDWEWRAKKLGLTSKIHISSDWYVIEQVFMMESQYQPPLSFPV